MIVNVVDEQPWKLIRWNFQNWSPYTEDKERQKKKQATWIGRWLFSPTRELTYEACYGYPPLTRLLKVYLEVLTVFSHVFSPDGINNTLFSQGCVLDTGPSVGRVDRTCIPRMGRGLGASDCLGPALGSTVISSSWWPPPTDFWKSCMWTTI